MAPSKLALFLAVNLALLTATANGCAYCPTPVPVPTPPIAVPPPAPVTPTPVPPTPVHPTPVPPTPVYPTPVPPTPVHPTPVPPTPVYPTPVHPTPVPPTPVYPTPVPPTPVHPTPVPPTGGTGVCSIDTLKLKVCANVLNLLKLNLGVPSTEQCCPLLSGLADLDAAVCLCTAIKANVLGIKLNVPVDLVLLLNQCGKTCPADFTCPI